jgi:hypothetical protein
MDLAPLEIYHDGPVKFRPDHLFLTFTLGEHRGPPDLLIYTCYFI